MSFLLKKSEQNKLAAVYLKDKEVYAAIAHCGYYSCYQKIVYILKEYFTPQYEDIKIYLAQKKKGGEHDQCIDEYIRQYEKLTDRRQAHSLGSKLRDLKAFRIEADYRDTEILAENVEQIENYMNEFHRLTKRNFKI